MMMEEAEQDKDRVRIGSGSHRGKETAFRLLAASYLPWGIPLLSSNQCSARQFLFVMAFADRPVEFSFS